jgi:hypothetical protein
MMRFRIAAVLLVGVLITVMLAAGELGVSDGGGLI